MIEPEISCSADSICLTSYAECAGTGAFIGDVKILVKTVVSVFRREGINEEGMATAMDLGDYLLQTGKVEKEEYDEKQDEAKKLLGV